MREILEDISFRWNRCESLLKTCERLRSEVNAPAINELRYAGRRFVDAVLYMVRKEGGPESTERKAAELLTEARHFCMRAEHDCVDAIVLYIQALIKKYEEEFDRDLLRANCPRMSEFLKKRKDIDEMIIASREERHRRDDIYQNIISQHLPELIAIAEELDMAADVLKTEHSRRLKRYAQMEQDYRRISRDGNTSLIIGVIGVAIGIIGFVV